MLVFLVSVSMIIIIDYIVDNKTSVFSVETGIFVVAGVPFIITC